MTLRLPKDAGERTLLVLLLLATFLLVLEPGRVPLFEPDEGRYGEIPREMLATGDWVTPRLNGVLYFEKPPLYYWSVAASMAVLGPTELAVRLPGKLSAAGMVLLAAAFARRRYGARTGLLAGLVLASSLLVVALARIAIIDPMLSLAMSGAAFAFAAFAEGDADGDGKRARRALYGFHVACAAAVLLKGLIGVVLPGGAIVFWTIVNGPLADARAASSRRGRSSSSSPSPFPWHVAMARRHPDFLQFYFVHEHFDRFAKTEHKRTGPLVYFVPVLLAGFLPWTAFLGRLEGDVAGPYARGVEGARDRGLSLDVLGPRLRRSSRCRARSSSRTSSRSGRRSPSSSRSGSSGRVSGAPRSGASASRPPSCSARSSAQLPPTVSARATSRASARRSRGRARSSRCSAGSS